MAFRDGGFGRDQKREAVVEGCLKKIRMYVMPFYVGHRASRGDGVLFVQSSNPLEDFFFEGDVTRRGAKQDRRIVCDYADAPRGSHRRGRVAATPRAPRGASAGRVAATPRAPRGYSEGRL